MPTIQLEGIVAVFVPLLVSVLKSVNFSATINALIAVVVYAAVGIASVVLSGQTFSLDNILPTVALFTATGTVAYQLFWKNWGDPQVTAGINAGTVAPAIPATEVVPK